eukprot:Em0008g1160a
MSVSPSVVQVEDLGKISKQVQFVLQDVVDLRDNKWVPRQRQDTKVKTIDQIHREAEDEEQMTKQLASQYIGEDGGDERKGSRQVERNETRYSKS